jgi:hypothetical protein
MLSGYKIRLQNRNIQEIQSYNLMYFASDNTAHAFPEIVFN